MVRLIDADKMIADILTVDPQFKTMIDWCIRVTEAQPTMDAVPVIRCKDCKHWDCDDSESYCLEHGIFNTDMNSYCSYAKRKEHETD